MFASPIELLQHLIRIPSENPDDLSQQAKAGEGAMAAFLVEMFAGTSAQVIVEEVKPGRPNVIVRFAPLDGRPRVLFGPHMDTVGVEGMTIDPFGGELHHQRIWGRGASDTKGSMAAMLWALMRHQADLASMPIAVDFVAFMGEESGQWGSKHFAQHHASDYAFAVVGEPTSLDVVYSTKGSSWIVLAARGKAAHSSMLHMGDNAVLKLASALATLLPAVQERLGDHDHPFLGKNTINVGAFHGGTRANIVPDWAQAEMDIRTTPGLQAAGGAVALVREQIEALNLPIEMVRQHENLPMETSLEHPLVQLLLHARPGAKAVTAPWFSDAAHLSAAGLPSVCLGPGSIAQAHSANEYIAVQDLLDGVEHFSAFLTCLKRA